MRSLERTTRLTAAVAVLALGCEHGPPSAGSGGGSGSTTAVPVEVAAIERGPFSVRRTFSGSLEPTAQFVAAPKVGGRIERLPLDLGDEVERGQLVAELDDDEYEQALARERAELDVARATLTEARAALAIAGRELTRARELRAQGVMSDADLDVVESEQVARQAAVEVAAAQVARADASVAGARIRLAYTQVTARWHDGDDRRVVAARFVDVGETVAANSPLLSIVELDPIEAVVFATEKDYGQISVGQRASLTTDAFPGVTFEGTVARVAPVFRQSSRQARIELDVHNPDHRLKPGMFVRVEVTLAQVEDVLVVPEAALTRRAGELGLFVVGDDERVRWRPVETRLRQDDRVVVAGDGLAGRVVTVGQNLLDDGSAVHVTAATAEPEPP